MVEALGDAVDASWTRQNKRVGVGWAKPIGVAEIRGILLGDEILDSRVITEQAHCLFECVTLQDLAG